MTKEMQIMTLEARKRLLAARGPHNVHIIAKINRQIRALER